MTYYSFNDLTQRDSTLAQLVASAQAMLALNTAFCQLLPIMLAEHCRAVRIRDDELVLSANNGTVAARLRMIAPTLLPTLAKQGYVATRVKVQVNIRYAPPKRKKTTYISHAALDRIDAACAIIRDPGIREALTRLVQHHRD